MVGIPLLGVLFFIWFPAVATVLLSFTKWNGIGGLKEIKSDGVQNYVQAATNYPPFWPAVRHNVLWLVVFLVLATPLGMLFAVVLDRNLRGSRIYQSLLFLPVMLSLALIGIIWELIYSPNFGLLNNVIGRSGQHNLIDWLGNPNLNLWAVLVEACWRQAPYVMVLYLAGLKAVDPSLREAALVDGAGPWQTFWRVVFPVMRPINVVILVITVIDRTPPPGFESEILLELPMVLVVEKNSKIKSAEDLWHQDHITEPLICLPAHEQLTKNFAAKLQEMEVEWFPTMEASSADLIETYVAAGLGIGVSVAVPAMKLAKNVKCLPLKGFPPALVGARWRGKKAPLVESFLDMARQRARDISASNT